MSIVRLPDKVRQSPLGTGTLNRIIENTEAIWRLLSVEHLQSGAHNSLEVARAVAGITFNSGSSTYSVATGSSDSVSSVSRTATGNVLVTLGSSYVEVLRHGVRVTVTDPGAELLPHIAMWTQASTTEIRVYLYRLESLAGNIWSAIDANFDIAVHASPVPFGTTPPTGVTTKARGVALGADSNSWNQVIAHQADLYSAITSQHTIAGTHNAREIARGKAYVQWDTTGTRYDIYSASFITGATRVSQGIVELDHDTKPDSDAIQVFCSPDFARISSGSPGDLHVINFPTSQRTATTFRAYIYKYDEAANEWDRADSDFSVSVHTGPS